MRAALLLALALLPVPSLVAQSTAPDRDHLALLLLARLGDPWAVVGAQAEYAGFERVAPWVSIRLRSHEWVHSCFDCKPSGWSSLAGVRLKAGPWARVAPYLTLGIGWIEWDDGKTETAGTAHAGFALLGWGLVRPRIEFGYESGTHLGVNLGVGLVL